MTNFFTKLKDFLFYLSLVLTFFFIIMFVYLLGFQNNSIFNSQIEDFIKNEIVLKYSVITLFLISLDFLMEKVGYKSYNRDGIEDTRSFYLILLITYFLIFINSEDKSLTNIELSIKNFSFILFFIPYFIYLIRIPIKRIQYLEIDNRITKERILNLENNTKFHMELIESVVGLIETSNNLNKEKLESVLSIIQDELNKS
jgi:hypothetical protein